MQINRSRLNKLMPVWPILFGVIAYLEPAPFTPLGPYLTYLLGGVIMLMSLKLTVKSLGEVFTRPRAVIGSVVIKWVTVPLAAVVAARVFYNHQPALAAGTILDGSMPAGVISNLLTFIAHGSIALAICLTFIHTLLSPFLTPAFTSVLASKYVTVNFFGLLLQLLQLVVAPVLLGWLIRYCVGEQRIKRAEGALPIVSAILVYAVEMGLISHAAPAIRANLEWVPVVVAVTSLLTVVNLVAAYVLAKALRLSEREARAVMFDVGIYNSGLGAVLAGLNFGPLSVLPPMMNSVMNLIIGTIIATFLHSRVPADEPDHQLAAIEVTGAAE